MKNTLLSFWRVRSEREKWTLMLGALFLLVSLLYALVWQPADKARTRLRAALPQLRLQAALMHRQAMEIHRLQNSLRTPTAAIDIKSELEASARHHHLDTQLSVLTVDAAGNAQLTMNAVPFAQWIAWLGDLQQQNHILLQSGHIQALGQPGMVRINATLTGPSTE